MLRVPRLRLEGEPVVMARRLHLWPIYGICPWDIGFVQEVQVVKERGFGVVVLTAEMDTICPEGMALFMDVGQDRVTAEPCWVPAFGKVAAKVHCIQPSESRSWRGKAVEMKMLPASLRGKELDADSLSARWKMIVDKAQAVGSKARSVRGLLKTAPLVFSPAETSSFAFCRGVLIQLDGNVVGLEIAPSPDQFEDWWQNFGLRESWQWEAENAQALPVPLGVGSELVLSPPEEDGLAQIEVDDLRGWAYWREGMLVYASLISERLGGKGKA